MFLIGFPLLLVPFALYNMIAFLLNLEFGTAVFTISATSGRMMVSVGDMLVLLGIFLLYFEILKSTRMSSKKIMDHALSVILFVAMLTEFITVQRAATSTFLILLTLSIVEVIGGFTISIRTASRDVTFETPDRTP
jgi:hypothetical protein